MGRFDIFNESDIFIHKFAQLIPDMISRIKFSTEFLS